MSPSPPSDPLLRELVNVAAKSCTEAGGYYRVDTEAMRRQVRIVRALARKYPALIGELK